MSDPSASAAASAGGRSLRVGVFGAALDTGNLGVSALGLATLIGLRREAPDLEAVLFDYGRGRRPLRRDTPSGPLVATRFGLRFSRRVYRTDNLQTLGLAARLGLSGAHPVARWLRSFDALLDISGGDSFADLYGARRFAATLAPKELALDLGVPLVLLPQTYGPFEAPAHREAARRVVQRARQSWARDARSFAALEALDGGSGADLRQGVDVAFGLPATEPAHAPAFVERRAGSLLVGLNPSGLIHNAPPGRDDFGLASDYRGLMLRLARRLLAEPGVRLLLVSHVVRPCADYERDLVACQALAAALEAEFGDRVAVAPERDDPMETKWLIGRCDWFCGTRMHACIAGLSQGVPTVGLAYSDKARGVFESARLGSHVVDLRTSDAEQVERRVVESLGALAQSRADLARAREALDRALSAQFAAIVAAVRSGRSEGG